MRRFLPHSFLPLFCIATVTALLAANPYEGVRPDNLLQPLIVAVCIGAVCWAAVSLFTRNRLLRSLGGLAAALPVLVSGYLFAWVRGMEASLPFRARGEVFLLGIVIGLGIYAAKRISRRGGTARFLNLFALLTVLLTLPAVFRSFNNPSVARSSPTVLPDTTGLERPDIFLVVLDAYSGRESLRDVYSFDNSALYDSLEVRGFAFPHDARSNYTKTFLSVGSMLNRSYYDELTISDSKRRGRDVYNNRMEFNLTAMDLKRLGYEYMYVGSSYPPLASNRLADVQFSERPSREFEKLWYSTTALQPLLQLCGLAGACTSREVPFDPESAEATEARLAFLNDLAGLPARKFVFAHWLLPHGPYRFDSDCVHTPSRWTVGPDAIANESEARQLYVEQVRCTNRRILEFVDLVRANPRPSVVILQADHGHGRFPGDEPSILDEAAPDQVRERFDVFAAYSGPGSLADSLASHRTPVNVFRTLFRVLWGVDEPPLADRFFWSEGKRVLELREVQLP